MEALKWLNPIQLSSFLLEALLLKDTASKSQGEDGRWSCDIFFVIGGPSSGKATVCKTLAEAYDAQVLEVEQLLAGEKEKETKDAERIRFCAEHHRPVTTELLMRVLRGNLQRAHSKVVVVRAFPWMVEQAIMFQRDVAPPKGVLYFHCPEEILQQRVIQRASDSGANVSNEEAERFVHSCLRQWNEVKEWYELQGKLIVVDASGSPQNTSTTVLRYFRGLGHHIRDEQLVTCLEALPTHVLEALMLIGRALVESEEERYKTLVTSSSTFLKVIGDAPEAMLVLERFGFEHHPQTGFSEVTGPTPTEVIYSTLHHIQGFIESRRAVQAA